MTAHKTITGERGGGCSAWPQTAFKPEVEPRPLGFRQTVTFFGFVLKSRIRNRAYLQMPPVISFLFFKTRESGDFILTGTV